MKALAYAADDGELGPDGSTNIAGARPYLRASSSSAAGDLSLGPARVLSVDPQEGTSGIFRDTPVVALLSHPADRESLRQDVFVVTDPRGRVPGRVRLSPDGRVVVWHADRWLTPGVTHEVQCAGLRDHRGRALASHHSRFVPCDLTWSEVG